MAIAACPSNVRRWAWLLAAGAAALAGGCQMPHGTGASTEVRRLAVGPDAPCPERLGEICTRLLLYYSKHRELPPRLEDLGGTGPRTPLRLACPASGQAYLYSREGIAVAHTDRRIVVQDASPCHAGTRWVIAADPAKPGKPRVIQVLRLSAKAELSEN